jgi:hypothetical protein
VQGGGGSCGFEWLFRTLLVTLVQGDGWPDDGLSRAVGFCHAFWMVRGKGESKERGA